MFTLNILHVSMLLATTTDFYSPFRLTQRKMYTVKNRLQICTGSFFLNSAHKQCESSRVQLIE